MSLLDRIEKLENIITDKDKFLIVRVSKDGRIFRNGVEEIPVQEFERLRENAVNVIRLPVKKPIGAPVDNGTISEGDF
jgi:hypothetical protein